jgi:ABC-type cobalamin/Fe3+-siderophores transport system ATPase subunit
VDRAEIDAELQILALMERFYEPLDGLVLLDDTDLSTYDPSWLHSQIAYASQVLSHAYHVMVRHACVREEPFCFSATPEQRESEVCLH